MPSASGLYIALRNIFLFWLTKLQMLWVCFLTSFCCLSFSLLYKNVPNRHEYKWSKINVRKCSLNSNACGNCDRTCHTQSINCKKTGDLEERKCFHVFKNWQNIVHLKFMKVSFFRTLKMYSRMEYAEGFFKKLLLSKTN